MALYAVGDLQGCLLPLKHLLDHIRFNPGEDILWLTGDLVCRGPNSIDTLKFVRSLGESAKTVLGNHDLHLIACSETGKKKPGSDIEHILSHPEAPELIQWLSQQPILIQDKERALIMTHAGIPPQWSDNKAIRRAKELEACLAQQNSRSGFFKEMYGSKPNTWSSNLTGYDRLRYIVNAYTRMRFCGPDGKLEFKYNGASSNAPTGMKPWFQWPAHKRNHKVVFGHWAALMGMTQTADFIALDSGYVWGNYLTLMNLDTKVRYLCDIDNNITEIGETDFLKLEHPL